MTNTSRHNTNTTGIIIAIIAAAVLIVGVMIIMEQRREVNEKYPGCWRLIGEDLECKAKHASRRLMGF